MIQAKNDTQLVSIRRRVYFFALLFGIAIAFVFWLNNRTEISYVRYVFPPLIIFNVVMVLAVRTERYPFGKVEKILFAGISFFWLSRYAFGINQLDMGQSWSDVNLVLFFGFFLFVTFTHLVFDGQLALWIATGGFLVNLVTGLLRLLQEIQQGILDNISLFILFEFNFAVMIGLVYALGQIKTELAKSTVQAEMMEKLASQDSLTGLVNRRGLDAILKAHLAVASRYKKHLTLIMFDIDHFKRVNDTYGHQVGDEVLRDAAHIVQALVRSSDTVCRWGGEEFMVVCTETDLPGGQHLAERLRASVEQHEFSQAIPVTASFGVATFLADMTFDELTRAADDQLYQAKEAGRNRVMPVKDDKMEVEK
jgi:diguanylate cyclase (GGDEF)-like protein